MKRKNGNKNYETTSSSSSTQGTGTTTKETNNSSNEIFKKLKKMATIRETLMFIWGCGSATRWFFCIGSIAAFLNGCLVPLTCTILYFGVQSGASMLGAGDGDDFVVTEDTYNDITRLSIILSFVGIFSFVMTSTQSICFDIVGRKASRNLGKQWFLALLRQDSAFFDVNDAAGIANSVHPNCIKYQDGMGKRLGLGIQNSVSIAGGVLFAMGSSWKISLLVFAICPILLILSILSVRNNQQKSLRNSMAYTKAAGVAYTTVSSIKTVFACNSTHTMIQRYKKATQDAFQQSTKLLLRIGLTNGMFVLYQSLFL